MTIASKMPFYRPAEDSIEIQYLRARKEALGGYTPKRSVRSKPLTTDNDELFKELLRRQRRQGSLDDDGVCRDVAENAEGPRNWQACGANRSR